MELGLRNMDDSTFDQLRGSLRNVGKVLRTSIDPARRSIGAFTASTIASIRLKIHKSEVEKDEFSDDGWSESEFSDFESEEETPGFNNAGNYDMTFPNQYNDDAPCEVYENFETVVKTDEMRKTPPTLPPRKTDFSPKPPARHKKEKKPALPEKIHTDQEDNQFYEEMSQMTLKSSLPSIPPAKKMPTPPTKKMPTPPTKCQLNKTSIHVKVDDDDYVLPTFWKSSQDQHDEPPSIPPFKLPPRKMPAIPPVTSNDTTPPNKTSMLHSSVSSRPRIDPPNEKTPENPLNAFGWYHGDSERVVVEKKLLQFKKDGMFAVRNSKTKGPSYPYAVTLYQSGKTYNFPIRIRDSDKRFALGTEKQNEPSFETLENLVDYFKINKIKLVNNQSALLNIPLDRSS